MTRDELLTVTRREHDALRALIVRLSEDELRTPSLAGGWSMKDVVAHITTWERRIMRLVAAADRGEAVAWPEEGFALHEIDRLNERDFLAHRDRPTAEVLLEARDTQEAYLRWIESFGDDEIPRERTYTPGLTLERMIRGNGDQHIREHRNAVEQALNGAQR